jgi:hypothetical protein
VLGSAVLRDSSAAGAKADGATAPFPDYFIAHASYRVTGDAVPMGEAAGQASVESLRKGVLPRQLVDGEKTS